MHYKKNKNNNNYKYIIKNKIRNHVISKLKKNKYIK